MFETISNGAEDTTVPVTWRGRTYDFRAMSVFAAKDGRVLLAAATEHVAQLFSKTDDGRLNGFRQERITDAEGRVVETTETQPLSVEAFEAISSRSAASAKAMIGMLTDEHMQKNWGVLILDACPDLHQGCINENTGTPKPVAVMDFLRKLRLPDMIPLIGGVIQANAEAFGTEGKLLVAKVKERLKSLQPSSGEGSTPGP